MLSILIAFAAAIVEAVAVLGVLVPGTPILMAVAAAGAMAGASMVPIMIVAILGAVIGDFVSYWVGHRFRFRLRGMWPFAARPASWATPRRSSSYGSASVAICRFVPVLRSTVPLVAGMAGMARTRFLIANVSSAFVWAPAHVVPAQFAGLSLAELQAGDWASAALCGAGLLLFTLAGWYVHRPGRRRALKRISHDGVGEQAARSRLPEARSVATLVKAPPAVERQRDRRIGARHGHLQEVAQRRFAAVPRRLRQGGAEVERVAILQHVAEHVVEAADGRHDDPVAAAAVLDVVGAAAGIDDAAGAGDPHGVVAGGGDDRVVALEGQHAFGAAAQPGGVERSADEQRMVARGRDDVDVAQVHHRVGIGRSDGDGRPPAKAKFCGPADISAAVAPGTAVPLNVTPST